MASKGQTANVAKVLEQCIAGEVPESNALPQLLHLHRSDARAVVAALAEKATTVVQQADAGQAATRAGQFLINVAGFLDRQREPEAAPKAKKGAAAAEAEAPLPEVSRPLLDHILLLSGGKNRGSKDKATRAQGCTLISALVAQVPEHKAAEEKLLEFALDKVPSIREKAVRGLAGLKSPTAEMALMARTTDQCTAVRASAVRGLQVSSSTAGTLLERIDDVEACVRAQLFMRLSEQPASITELGPAALARLVVGLADRTNSVRSAAGQAVDAWVEHLGGVLPLLSRCDLKSDEALGEAAAAALAARFLEEGSRVARQWLGQVTGKDKAKTLPDGPAPVLMARLALANMSEADREEVLDVASLVQRAHAVLEASQKKDANSTWQEYLLRQLLHVVALADIGDEGLRRQVEKLAEAVLFRSPLPCSTVTEIGTTAGTFRMAQSAIDLGIVILRKVSGLVRFQAQTAKHQAVEARCSTRVVLLVSEICQPFETSTADEEGDEGPFTTRLSLQIQELNGKIEELQHTKANIDQAKKKALAAEDYLQAQKLKEQTRKNEKELTSCVEERDRLLKERDGVCLRVLAIVSALLRWSNSEIRKDPALMGTLDQILLPLVGLPALSKEVEVAVVSAICLFCVRDGAVARSHWSLLLELLRGLQEVEKASGTHQPGTEGFAKLQSDRARAAVAARALADCARIHGGFLDRNEVLSCAQALAAVPFSSRQVVIEPLCGYMLSLGHIYFEEHLKEPVLEVQWALGWMLVEAFKQRRQPEDKQVEGKIKLVEDTPSTDGQKKRGLSWVTRKDEAQSAAKVDQLGDMDDGSEVTEAIAMASRMTQFFALLPKLPGKHGAPMLSLALESVCESGLWRRGVLLPHTSDGQTRWLRNFSWPELFSFVHERLPADMRFRLWRCSLQICVNDPSLAPLAEIPFALASVAADAPPGASELLQEALDLGADPEALGPLRARLPQLPEKAGNKKQKLPPAVGIPSASANPKLLVPPAAGKAAEQERREELASLGINIDVWAPGDLEVPKMVPQFHRMRMAVRRPRGAQKKGQENSAEVQNPKENALPVPAEAAAAKAPQEGTQEPEGKRRRRMGKQAEEAPARLPLQEIR
eukprot:CAMPEP_0197657848 /NCGR_PEP_ID=MMETSP1338-20131121/44875_1 /TAXON_ID=43686 ORGANISM="Pelagodinium beii, Strain RCC1491" /NCGR_SAMPLE_ID=MMETSP1338 /ASSEMBLY_ACC=CAM_ASM_000754 /LENGTH=1108 /DNA_ID=CAMNT_0043234309 /DNA_START=41 /DNA_END=3367 /DNA_ORIENTATION=+